METLIPIAAIFLIFWLLLIRPASKRQKALADVQRGLSIGDRVITSSGMFGTVATIDDDVIGLEVAPGVVISMARPSIVGHPREESTEADEQTDGATDQNPDSDQER